MAEEDYKRVFNGQYNCYMKYPQGSNDKILAGLCYLFGWIVSLVVLLGVKPLSPFLRFHAIQSLALNIITVGLLIISYVLMMFCLGFLTLPFVIGLGIYGFVIGIIILTGSDHRVPWLGNYVEEKYV